MNRVGRIAIVLLLFAFPNFLWAQQTDTLRPTVILISIDGFRPDYLDSTDCPNLRWLASEGVRAEWMIPVFPTKTFPNHYSIVTGLHPGHHGITANTMYDPKFDALFTMRKREEVTNARWWGGEPIWVTAEKQGLKTAPFFWPGSEAPIGGKRPTYWLRYDGSMSYMARVRKVLAWMSEPPDRRPSLITLYFEGVDHAGHEYGPSFAAVDTAVRKVDGALGTLLEGLDIKNQLDRTNIIVVSDHGMAATEKDKTIWLDEYIGLDSVRTVDWGPIVSVWVDSGHVQPVFQALSGAHPHMKVYRKADLPDRWYYRDHRRVAPITLVADDGWMIASKRFNPWQRSDHGGNHGYDNANPSMRALFLARGPSFRRGVVLPPFQVVHVYSLLAHLLGVAPVQTDGNLEPFRKALR
ncbi:MAG: alkaline phosphatase family protein [Bacteroidia bacterium]|nr:MAG: alkaline phosphatase family protein [Bacteroidia bacterium]